MSDKPPQPPQQPGFYQYVAQPPSNGQAVAALVLGIIAVVIGIWSPVPFIGVVPAFIAFPLSVLAIIFGHIGLGASKRIFVGRGQALAGMVLGYVTLGIVLLTVLIWIVSLTTSSFVRPFFYSWL